MEKAAYDVINKVQPTLLGAIKILLNLKQTPKQIADRYIMQDISLAALIELAATYMLEEKEL